VGAYTCIFAAGARSSVTLKRSPTVTRSAETCDVTRRLGRADGCAAITIVAANSMAIDAKDQITHGHIRRVQIYAVGLARHLGVTDDQLLKAIEAAALLHDMGKLAVPEHILNKPGKLTPAEFEKMKLHAGVGADILSAIDFPYPVVPIVRHHHENWNGTGYPAGLRGTDIPIGARILSVVDCFDALTSDRPYRPKLSDREALDILIERRGTMYDPLVVDTFVRVHMEISPEQVTTSTAVSKGALTEITTSSTSGREPVPDSEHSIEPSSKLTIDLAAQLLDASLSDADVLRGHIVTLVQCELAILFSYDGGLDQLAVEATSHASDGKLKDLRIGLGERLSGWVAANRRTILNSDPALDLGEFARKVSPVLQNTLSVPLTVGKDLIGVLALYRESAFSDDERSLLEFVGKPMAERMATRRRRPNLPDLVTSPRKTEAQTLAPVSSLVVRAARIFLAAAAAAVAGLGPGHSAQADSTCPTATFLSFDHVAYISKAIPAGVEIPVGTGLGSGSLDQPASPDGCKRERDSVQVLTAGSLEPGVAVLVQGRPRTLFVLGRRCDNLVGQPYWNCLLRPLVFESRSYTGTSYPLRPSPRGKKRRRGLSNRRGGAAV